MLSQSTIMSCKAVHPLAVVEALAKPARERYKWSCVACGSSDGMHVSRQRDRAKCYACGESWDAIGLVASASNLEFIEACRELARLVGIDVEEGESSPSRRRMTGQVMRSPRCPSRSSRIPESQIEAARDLIDRLYEETLDPLDDEACRYLEGRKIDPLVAQAAGVRSWSPWDWARVASADPQLTRLAGLRRDNGDVHPYWSAEAQQTALVTPYRDWFGRVVSLQFRPIRDVEAGGKRIKDWSLRKVEGGRVAEEAGAFVPADQERGPCVYVVEGTIDALSIRMCGRSVVAAPGSGAWRDDWSRRHLAGRQQVIVFADADEAGKRFAARVVESVRTHCPNTLALAVATTTAGCDANDMLREGELEELLLKAESAASAARGSHV